MLVIIDIRPIKYSTQAMSSAIYFVSNDLRIHDNEALAMASQYDSLFIVYRLNADAFKSTVIKSIASANTDASLFTSAY